MVGVGRREGGRREGGRREGGRREGGMRRGRGGVGSYIWSSLHKVITKFL